MESAQLKSGHLMVPKGQLSMVEHMKIELAHSPPGQTIWELSLQKPE